MGMSGGQQQKAGQPQPMNYGYGSKVGYAPNAAYQQTMPAMQGQVWNGPVQQTPSTYGNLPNYGPNGQPTQVQMPTTYQSGAGNMLGSAIAGAKAGQTTNEQSVVAPTIDSSTSPATPTAAPADPNQPPPMRNWQGWATGGRMGPQDQQSPWGTGRMLGPAQLTQTGGPNQLGTGYPTNQNNPNGAGKKGQQPPPMGAGGAQNGPGSGGGMGKGTAPPVPNGPGATAGSGANPANKALAGYGAHPDLMNAGLTEAQLMPLVGHLGVNDPFRQQMIAKYGGQEGLNQKINQYGAGGGNDYNPQMNAWAQQYAAAINPALSQQARDFNRQQLAGSPYAALLGG